MADAITKNVGKVWAQAANTPWELHCDPFRIAPQMYYIGNTWVGVFLIDTKEGLILLDTGVFEAAYDFLNNIYALGYDPKEIRHIFLTHAHPDHIGSVNQFLQVSKDTKIWLSRTDTEFLHHPINQEEGIFKVPEIHVDCFYDDNVPFTMGNVTIRTRLAPGHTPGTSAFFISMPDENGKTVTVGIHGGVGTNSMSDEYLAKWHLDPTLRQQFIDGCEAMKSEHVDITIPSHPAHGDLMSRRGADANDYRPLVDEDEWARFLEIRKKFAEDLNQKN
ncbi:MAG: MBL fold metallo-hydrolase [Bulleidia sp.]|nr:MBL fold metallo-hydrolase [Bulleidia sp.]